VQRFLYASSSSVYGLRDDAPFQEDDRTDRPQSFYAATKLANEAMACAYHAQYGLASLGMRFFTVYGPWGRPDMAPLMFARKLLKGETLRLFAKGELLRDFTYVGDTVAAIDRLLHRPQGAAAAEVVNVGHRRPVQVKAFVEILARLTGTVPVIEFAPMQVADVRLTCASEDRLLSMIGSWPDTPLEQGLKLLVDWLQAWEFDRGQPG
jgi:UDP-glucuronate 4-epimerase